MILDNSEIAFQRLTTGWRASSIRRVSIKVNTPPPTPSELDGVNAKWVAKHGELTRRAEANARRLIGRSKL